MEELSKLKHLRRGPLPLNRIPDRLCIQIIEKQSVAPLFNLPHTNSRYSILVENALARNSYVTIVRELLEFYDKEELFNDQTLHLLFPASEYLGSFCSWIITIYLDIKCHLGEKSTKRSKRVLPKIERLKYINTSHISELWEDEQRLGPKKIALQPISKDLWKKVLSKTVGVTATRLARINSTVSSALDDYIESTVPVRVMVKNSHLLTKKHENPIRWLMINEYENFYNSSLLTKSMCKILWKFSSPVQTPEEEEIIKRLMALAAEKTQKVLDEIRQRHALFGQEYAGPRYSPDKAALHVPVESLGTGVPLLEPVIALSGEDIQYEKLYTTIKMVSSHQVEIRRRNPNWKEDEARLERQLFQERAVEQRMSRPVAFGNWIWLFIVQVFSTIKTHLSFFHRLLW